MKGHFSTLLTDDLENKLKQYKALSSKEKSKRSKPTKGDEKYIKGYARQALLAGSFPWLVTEWGEGGDDDGTEVVTAAGFYMRHLKPAGKLDTKVECPLLKADEITLSELPIFPLLDRVLDIAKDSNEKVLVFSASAA